MSGLSVEGFVQVATAGEAERIVRVAMQRASDAFENEMQEAGIFDPFGDVADQPPAPALFAEGFERAMVNRAHAGLQAIGIRKLRALVSGK
jgi:hypothetical protein